VRIKVVQNRRYLLGIDRVFKWGEISTNPELDCIYDFLTIKFSFPAIELASLVANLQLRKEPHCFYASIRE
jgi:hypothetical protein